MTRPRKTLALSAMILLSTSSTLEAQEWSGFTFFFENDSFTLTGDGSDDGFTNGLRLEIGRNPASDNWVDTFDPWAKSLLDLFDYDSYYEGSSLVIGQNFFTPRVITIYEPEPGDRPFAGLLFLGIRSEATEQVATRFREIENDRGEMVPNPEVRCRGPVQGDPNLRPTCPLPTQSQTQTILEFSVGVLGQGAGGRILQAGAHVSPSSSRVPKGWSSQLRNRLHVAGYGQIRHRWARQLFGPLDVDFTPDFVTMLGSTQTYLGAGVTARVGWKMSGFPAQAGIQNAIDPKDTRSPAEFGLSFGVTGRAYAWNGLIESPFWLPSDPDVRSAKLVGDYRFGAFYRLYDWRLDWFYQIRRSPEVLEPGPSYRLYDNYGSLQISHQPGSDHSLFEKIADSCLGGWLQGAWLEVGFGWERGRTAVQDEAPVVRTTAFHAGAGIQLPAGFDLGYELTGVGREFPSDGATDEDHADRLLNQSGFVLGWTPPLPRKLSDVGQLRLRVGRQGSAEEYEVAPNTPGDRGSPCPDGTDWRPGDPEQDVFRYCSREQTGSGWSWGIGYTLNFGEALGLHVETSWHDLGFDDSDYDFSSLTVGMRWAPRFRR